jgi:hypothetical protein
LPPVVASRLDAPLGPSDDRAWPTEQPEAPEPHRSTLGRSRLGGFRFPRKHQLPNPQFGPTSRRWRRLPTVLCLPCLRSDEG